MTNIQIIDLAAEIAKTGDIASIETMELTEKEKASVTMLAEYMML